MHEFYISDFILNDLTFGYMTILDSMTSRYYDLIKIMTSTFPISF